MVTIRPTISKKKRDTKSDNEILLRISFNRQKVYRVKSNIYVNKNFWNKDKEEVKIPRMHGTQRNELIQIQNTLNSLKTFIIEESVKIPEEEINKEWINETIHIFHFGKPMTKNSKVTQFDELFLQFISIQVKTEHRKTQFMGIFRMLKRFELYTGHEFKLDIDKLEYENIINFENFLKIEYTFFNDKGECIKNRHIYEIYHEKRIPQPRGGNAIFAILKCIRTFYNWAVKTGKTQNNPFKKYKLQECVYGTPFFLTVEELNKIFEFDFSSQPRLALYRDIFILQSCLGMRVSDFFQLTKDNIIGDAIEYIPSKTINENGDTVRVPLTKKAKIIIERNYDSNRIELLPFTSQQKYNIAIKKIIKTVGITRTVTVINPTTRKEERKPIYEIASSHMARRNFIGNLYNKVQDPNAIGSMTGHIEGSKAFARYRNIDDNIKKNIISFLE